MCWLVKVAFVIPRNLLADATQSRELQERKPKLMVSQSGFYTQYTDIAKFCLTATATHVPYGITQYYLPPGRGDDPAFTPAEAGTRLSDPGGMQG